jgi:hypothetical protein
MFFDLWLWKDAETKHNGDDASNDWHNNAKTVYDANVVADTFQVFHETDLTQEPPHLNGEIDATDCTIADEEETDE